VTKMTALIRRLLLRLERSTSMRCFDEELCKGPSRGRL